MMSSLAEQSLMLDALSGSVDPDFEDEFAAMREDAARNPDKWRWCIAEAKRRSSTNAK